MKKMCGLIARTNYIFCYKCKHDALSLNSTISTVFHMMLTTCEQQMSHVKCESNYTKQVNKQDSWQLMLSCNQCTVHACDWCTLILVLDNHINCVGMLSVQPKVVPEKSTVLSKTCSLPYYIIYTAILFWIEAIADLGCMSYSSLCISLAEQAQN